MFCLLTPLWPCWLIPVRQRKGWRRWVSEFKCVVACELQPRRSGRHRPLVRGYKWRTQRLDWDEVSCGLVWVLLNALILTDNGGPLRRPSLLFVFQGPVCLRLQTTQCSHRRRFLSAVSVSKLGWMWVSVNQVRFVGFSLSKWGKSSVL